MRLKSLSISNFQRYGEQSNTIVFPEENILIVGENQDSAGSDSNGSGKTGIPNSISWSLFGEAFKDISADEVIRRGTTKCLVKTVFENNNVEYIIERERSGKESLSFHVNKEDLTRRLTSQTQDEIFNVFSLDPKKYLSDFKNTVYYSAAIIDGFASKATGNKDRMALLTRFLNLSNYDLASTSAKDKKKIFIDENTNNQVKINQMLSSLPKDFKSFESYSSALKDQIIELTNTKDEWIKYKSEILRIRELSSVNNQIEKDIKAIEETFKYKISTEEKDFELKISKLEDSIENLEEAIKRVELEIQENEKKKTILNNLDTEWNAKNIGLDTFSSHLTYVEVIDNLSANINKESTSMQMLKKEKQSLESQLLKPLVCPKCSSDLNYSDGHLHEINIEELQRKIKDLESSISTCIFNINTWETKRKETEKEYKDLQTLKNDLDKLEVKIETIRNTVKQDTDFPNTNLLKEEIWHLTEDAKIVSEESVAKRTTLISELEYKITELKNKLQKDIPVIENEEVELKSSESQIELCNQEIGKYKEIINTNEKFEKETKELQEKIKTNVSIIAKYELWQNNFQAIKQLIIESYLPIFESTVNKYLSLINMGLRVTLSTEKEKKTGGMTQEFSILVTDEHGTVATYETFSEGEMRRIAICVGFALRDIAKTRSSLPFDFIMIDEVLDNLDATGVTEFFNLLQYIPGQKLIISHDDNLKQMFRSIIKVTRKNGVSTAKLIQN